MIKMKQQRQPQGAISKFQDQIVAKLVLKVLAFQNWLCSIVEGKANELSLQEQKNAFFLFCLLAFPLSMYLVVSGIGAHEMYISYRQGIKAPALPKQNHRNTHGVSLQNSSTSIKQGEISDAFIDSLIKMRIGQPVYDSLKVGSFGESKK